MRSLQFWNSWPINYRRILLVASTVFSFALIWVVIAFAQYPEPVYSWQQYQDLEQEEIPIYGFEVGGLNFTVLGENNIIFERWASNPMNIRVEVLDIYLALFSFSLIMLLSIITVVRRYWFFIGTGMVTFFFASFELETLEIGGLENKVPAAIAIAVTVGTCFIYQYFRKAASFLERMLTFSAIVGLMGVAVSVWSEDPHPLRYLAINTIPASILLLVIFITMVAHEIIGGFVLLAGQSGKRSNSLTTLLIISGVYLLNLWVVYWDRIGWLDWGLTVSPIVVLCISGVLAIWGIRHRQPQYEQIIIADPFAVYFILALGTISLSVIGYFLAAAHDVAVLSVNDLILYAHIGYGTVFLAYIGSNFVSLLMRNIPAYRVLYKPTAMPYFSYRFAGLIFTLAFLFYNTWKVPVNHFNSTFHAALGDLFAAEGNDLLALGYYEKAHERTPYNQHAATALAEFEAEPSLKTNTLLSDATQFRPTEFTILNYAHAYHIHGNRIEEALFLERARKQIPGSGAIENNLGLAYLRLGLNDTALYFLKKASNNRKIAPSANMNLLGLLVKTNAKMSSDSLSGLLNSGQERVISNALAYANQQRMPVDFHLELPKDSLLNLFSASMIGNYLTNHILQVDTVLLSRCVALAQKKVNINYREMILVPASKAYYAAGLVNRAFQILVALIIEGSNKGRHNLTLALWSLDQGKPDIAALHAQYSLLEKNPQAGWVNAVSLAETGKTNEAIVAWDTVSRNKDSLMTSLSESMKRVLGGPSSWYSDFSEQEKYQFLRYRVPLADSAEFDRLLNQIRDEDLKAAATLDRSKKFFDRGDIGRSSRTYQKLQGLHLRDNDLFSKIKYFELHLFSARNQWSALQEQIDKGILFGPYREHERVYFQTLMQLSRGDSTNATIGFSWLGQANPYFDEGIVAASDFFQKEGPGYNTSYHILSEALQVNPHSIKILKAYVLIALAKEYDEFAVSSFQTLQSLLTPEEMKKYVARYQLQALLLR